MLTSHYNQDIVNQINLVRFVFTAICIFRTLHSNLTGGPSLAFVIGEVPYYSVNEDLGLFHGLALAH